MACIHAAESLPRLVQLLSLGLALVLAVGSGSALGPGPGPGPGAGSQQGQDAGDPDAGSGSDRGAGVDVGSHRTDAGSGRDLGTGVDASGIVGGPCPCPQASGTYCDLTEAVCVVGCTEDPHCPPGQICDFSSRACVAGCRYDNDCATGQICEALSCRSGCRSDGECGSGQICVDLTCRTGCRQDGECGPGDICDGLSCRVGCRGDPDCAGAGSICDQATFTCTSGCRIDVDCALEQVCDQASYQCVAGCDGDARCSAGRICDQGACRAGCRADEDCPLETYCDPDLLTCEAGCAAQVYGYPVNSDRCPPGKACVSYTNGTTACTDRCYDPSYYTCAGDDWECFMSNTWHIVDEDHAAARCRQRCDSAADCPDGMVCATFSDDRDAPSWGSHPTYCARSCSEVAGLCDRARDGTTSSNCGCGADGICRASGGDPDSHACYLMWGTEAL